MSACILVCALLLASGCATPPPSATRLAAQGTLVEPPSFSDEVSRSLVRRTQELIALRSQDYRIGPDDLLTISIFEWELADETRTFDFRVSESGELTVPVLGAVEVGGKTLEEVQQLLETRLTERGVLQDPRVAVTIKEYRSRRVAVIGAVNSPGMYALHRNVTTLMDVLALAGGPSPSAGPVAYVLRSGNKGQHEPVQIAVDLVEFFEQGNFELNAVLEGGDTVYVPRAPLIYVYGAVAQPGGFEMREPLRVLEALALAGGLQETAAKRRCMLLRKTQRGAEQTVPVDVAMVERGEQADLYLRGGDVLHVPESSGKKVVYDLWDALRSVFTFTYGLNTSD